jgi:hypothetical protein
MTALDERASGIEVSVDGLIRTRNINRPIFEHWLRVSG